MFLAIRAGEHFRSKMPLTWSDFGVNPRWYMRCIISCWSVCRKHGTNVRGDTRLALCATATRHVQYATDTNQQAHTTNDAAADAGDDHMVEKMLKLMLVHVLAYLRDVGEPEVNNCRAVCTMCTDQLACFAGRLLLNLSSTAQC